ncbi:MAG: AAA family ATPase [Intrasporangium sp.]|uniref:AAA family ATPase n=1 Tax=Intrasporangium sp. TaxID=1925024 RepID=UPI00264747A1|nr:AAA family ATPase [Intrasporangium sp.]MDN5795482.1 AAA family ATPase [Intrasporangium sp.]
MSSKTDVAKFAAGVNPWPTVEIVTVAGAPARVVTNGATRLVEPTDGQDVRTAALAMITATAAGLGRPVRVTARDDEGSWLLVVGPDGSVTGDSDPEPPDRLETSTRQLRSPGPDDAQTSRERAAAAVADEASPATVAPVPEPAAATPPAGSAPAGPVPATRLEARASFLGSGAREEPATRGWRGAAARLGLAVAPGRSERTERDEMRTVSQHWPGPRTIAVVNGKGGASKTPTTILLAAVFARHGGAGVLTWDNNQTRGTLGWRTEQGPHEATLLDLLPASSGLLGTGAQSADLAHFVHHQTRDRYDVLRSKPLALATEQRVLPEDVDAIHAVAAKYYRLILLDSGNDESDPMWRRMIDLSDQIVVATTTRDDHAEAGALLLEGLAARDERSAQLASRAVAVVSQADPRSTRADVRRVVEGYSSLTRETVTIPWDPAMVDGVLAFGSLRPATARAWLTAASAVSRGL